MANRYTRIFDAGWWYTNSSNPGIFILLDFFGPGPGPGTRPDVSGLARYRWARAQSRIWSRFCRKSQLFVKIWVFKRYLSVFFGLPVCLPVVLLRHKYGKKRLEAFKTFIYLNIWPLARPNIAENLLGKKVVLACGAKTLDFRSPKSWSLVFWDFGSKTKVKSAWRRLKPTFFGFSRVWEACFLLKNY